MNMDPAKLAMAAAVVGAAVRLIKSNAVAGALESLGLPRPPKHALPWIALALGFLLAAIESSQGGKEGWAVLWDGIAGMLSGAVAIAGQETLGNSRIMGDTIARNVFGKGES